MEQLIIKNARVNGATTDILIENGRFKTFAPHITPSQEQCELFDACGMTIVPPFFNAHTHAAMTLFRGFADDIELFDWLNNYIWPAEAKLTPYDVYCGSKLAILEMIKSGTVFFNDMYWFQEETIRAVEEMGVRAAVGLLFLEDENGNIAERNVRGNQKLLEMKKQQLFSDRITLTLAPHAVYTVSERNLRRVEELAEELKLPVHIHLAETAREVQECRKEHSGLSPVEYLASLGLLNRNLIAAHSVHLSNYDIEMLADAQAVLVHMPCSNMKLNSGAFRFADAFKAGCRIALGTDGCASNNNLSMFDEMKFAALAAKREDNSPTAAPADYVFNIATTGGAEAFGIDSGEISPGKLADAVLINTDSSYLTGGEFIPGMVYSADSSVVDSVICNGRIIMKHRVVPGEKQIIEEGRKCAAKLRTK